VAIGEIAARPVGESTAGAAETSDSP